VCVRDTRAQALNTLHVAALDAAGALRRLEQAQSEMRALLVSNAELSASVASGFQQVCAARATSVVKCDESACARRT
jgi:hypothetical protein